MAIVELVIGFAVAAGGLLCIAKPKLLIRLAERKLAFFQRPGGFWTTFSLRLALGVLLLATASYFKSATTVLLLGCVIIASAVALPVIGKRRLGRLNQWVRNQNTTVVRIMRMVELACLVVGSLIVYAAT